jgi:hypothetical protein
MDGLVQQAIEGQLLSVAQRVEDQLDDQLHALDKLDADDIEALRERRLQNIKRAAARKQQWLAAGHGEYREAATEKDFFAEVKAEERVVCHFYRDSLPCKVMDKHMQQLAVTHVETKFIKINAEKSPFLTERLKVWMLPTLALIRSGKTVDYVVGFQDLGGVDDFPTSVLEARLLAAGLLHEAEAPPAPPQRRSVRKGGGTNGARQQRTASDEDSDFSD